MAAITKAVHHSFSECRLEVCNRQIAYQDRWMARVVPFVYDFGKNRVFRRTAELDSDFIDDEQGQVAQSLIGHDIGFT
jgi:hypothetical protein